MDNDYVDGAGADYYDHIKDDEQNKQKIGKKYLGRIIQIRTCMITDEFRSSNVGALEMGQEDPILPSETGWDPINFTLSLAQATVTRSIGQTGKMP